MSNFSTITTADDYVNYVFQISTRGVSEATSELVGVGHTIQNVLGNLAFKTAEYLTHTETLAMSFGLAAAASFTHATKSAIAFQQATASVEAISGQQLSGSYIGERAMAMSNQFGLAVSDMTQGLEALARAGITAESSLNQLLQSGVQMSKFEGRDLEESINDILSTTNLLNPDVDMNSPEYAQIVADLNQRIISTSESAPINAKNIMDTIQHVGGYASAANLDQEDLFATIAQLGAKGTRGELAGTALRAFVSAGQKDTAQRALARIGLDVSDLWDESGEAMLPISEMKRVLDDALTANGYSAQQRLEFYSDFVGYKQANQIMKIDPSSIDTYKDKIDHAMSVTDKMNIILGTVQGTWSQISNTVSNFMTKVGGVLLPVIHALLVPIKFIVQAIDAIPFGHVPVAAGLLLVSFKGIAVAINNIIPTIASFMLNMDRTQENAKGISGFVKETVRDLKQAKDILLSVRNPEAMAQHVRERTIKSTNKRMQKDLESAAIEEILRQQMGVKEDENGMKDYVWNTLSDQEKTYYMEIKRPDQSAIDAEVESIMKYYNLRYRAFLDAVHKQDPQGYVGDEEGNLQPIPAWAPPMKGWTGIETIGMDWAWLEKTLNDIAESLHNQNNNHDPWREPFGGNRPPSGGTASGGSSSTSGGSSRRSSSSGSSSTSGGSSSSDSSSSRSSSSSGSSSSSSGASSSNRSSSSSSSSGGSSSSGSPSSNRSSSGGSTSSSSGSSSRREHSEEIVNVLTSTFNLNAKIYNKLDTILSTLIECCGRKAEKVSQASNNPSQIPSNTHTAENTRKSSGTKSGSKSSGTKGSSKSSGTKSSRKSSGTKSSGKSSGAKGGRKSSGTKSSSKPSSPKAEQPSFSQGTTPPKQDIPDFNKQAQELLASAIMNAHTEGLGHMSSKDLNKALTPDKIRNISPEKINEAIAGYNKPVKGKDRPYPIKSISKNTPIEKMEEKKSQALKELYDRAKGKGGDPYFKQAGRQANQTFQLEDEKGNPKYYKVKPRLAGTEKGSEQLAADIREKYKGDDEDFYNMIKRQPWASGAENQSTMGGTTQPSQSNNANINDNIPSMTEDEEVYVDTDATLTVDGQNQEKRQETKAMDVNVSGGSGASVNNTSSFNPSTNIAPNTNTNINANANANAGANTQPSTSAVQTTFNVNTQNNMHDATSSENSQKILSGALGQGSPLSNTSQTTLSAFTNGEEEIEDNINVDATTHITTPSESENENTNNANMNIHVSGSTGGKGGSSGGNNSSMVINNNVSPNITTQMQMQKLDEGTASSPTNDINVNMNMQNTANNSTSFNNSQSLMNNVDNQSTLDDFQSSKPLLDLGLSEGGEEEMEIDMSDEIILPNLTNESSVDSSSGGSSSLTFDIGGGNAGTNHNTVVNNNINVSTPSLDASTPTLDNFMSNAPMTPALQQAVRPPASIPTPTKQTTLTGGANTPANNMNITMQDNIDNASAMSGVDVGGGAAVAPSAGSSLNLGGGMELDTGGEEDIYLDTSAVVDLDPSFLKGTTQQGGRPRGNFTLNMQPDKGSSRSNLAKVGSRGRRGGFVRPSGRSLRSSSPLRSPSSRMARTPNINTPSVGNFAGNIPQIPNTNTTSGPQGSDANNSAKISIDMSSGQGTTNSTMEHIVRVADNNASDNNLIGTQNAQNALSGQPTKKPLEVISSTTQGLEDSSETTSAESEEEIEVEVEDTGDLLLQPNFNLAVGIDGVSSPESKNTNKRLSCCDLILRALDKIINLLSSTQTTLTSSFEEITKPLTTMAEGVKTQQTVSESQHKETDEERQARYAQENQKIMSGLHGAAQENVEEWEKKRAERKRRIFNSIENQEIMSGLQYSTQYEAEKEAAARKQRMIDDNKTMFKGLWNAAQENYQTTPEYIREQEIRESYARAGDAYRGSIFGRIGSRISDAFTQDNLKDAKGKVNSGKKSLIDKLDAKLGPKLKDGDKELDIHREIFGEKGREAQEKMNAASGIAKDLGLDRTAEVIDFGSNLIGGTQERFGKIMKLSKDAQNLEGHFKVFKGKDGKPTKYGKMFQKAGGMVEKTLGKVATKFADFLPTLIEFLPVIAGVAAVAFVAVKALEWSAASHDAYVKKLKEEQKEYTARSQAEQKTYEGAKLRAVRGQFQNESQRTIANLQYELSTVRLEAANARRQATNIKLQTQEDDALWGEYGLRATLQRNGLGDLVGAGEFESQADKHQGTSKKIREVKEYSMSWNPFDNVTQAEREVASFYDAHTMAFAEIDNYKQELGELYDFETKMMRVTGSQEAARNSMQFQLMLDKQAEKMGMVGEEDKVLQYLDWMQTEQQVDTASQAMQAQADTMVGNAELKAMAISQGVTPEELQDISDPETRQKILEAQADMIRQQAASQLWWQGVWAALSSYMWYLITPFILVVDAITAIWDTMANIGLIIKEAVWGTDGWKQEDKDAIEGYHNRMKDKADFIINNPIVTEAQKSNAYFEASDELRNTDLSATGESAVSEWDRGDFGNAPSAGFTGGVSGTYMNQGTMNKTTGTTYQSKTTSSSSNNAKQTSNTSSSNNAQHTTNTSHNSQVTTHNQQTTQEDNKPKTLEEAVLSIEEMVRVIAQAMAPTAFLNNWGSSLFGDESSIPDNALDNVFSKGGNKNVQYGSQAPITINEVNINTEDDPEKIKTALMNLIVELQEQVSPRIVSRSIGGQSGNTDTSAKPEDQKTTDNKTSPTI